MTPRLRPWLTGLVLLADCTYDSGKLKHVGFQAQDSALDQQSGEAGGGTDSAGRDRGAGGSGGGQGDASLAGTVGPGSAGAGGLADAGEVGADRTDAPGVDLADANTAPDAVGTGGAGTGGLIGTGGAGGGTTVDHYVVSADGLTVTDTNTGLEWQRDGSGIRPECSGAGNLTCTWSEAQSYCAGLTLDGLGWRLPTLAELQSIVDLAMPVPGPRINKTAFPNTPPTWFWTSSPAADGATWYVFFYDGSSNNHFAGNSGRVRCVR